MVKPLSNCRNKSRKFIWIQTLKPICNNQSKQGKQAMLVRGMTGIYEIPERPRWSRGHQPIITETPSLIHAGYSCPVAWNNSESLK